MGVKLEHTKFQPRRTFSNWRLNGQG